MSRLAELTDIAKVSLESLQRKPCVLGVELASEVNMPMAPIWRQIKELEDAQKKVNMSKNSPPKKLKALLEELPRREAEVVELIRLGLSNGDIASRMGIKLTTVKTYVRRLYRQFDVTNRIQLLSSMGYMSNEHAASDDGDPPH